MRSKITYLSICMIGYIIDASIDGYCVDAQHSLYYIEPHTENKISIKIV